MMKLEQIRNGYGFRIEGGDAYYPGCVDVVGITKDDSPCIRGFEASSYLYSYDNGYQVHGIMVVRSGDEISLITYTRYNDEENPFKLSEYDEIIWQWEEK